MALTVIILMPMDSLSSLLLNLPSRRLRWVATAARLLLWLLVAAWLLFAASWGLLHGWIVPRIGEFRPRLEIEAGKALGVPVRIGQITAQSSGMIPSIELRDVVLLDPQGREAVRLPRLVATLSPSSLWSRGFEQLFIDQPALEIRRSADGTLFVGGLDVSQKRNDSSALADWFFSQTEFTIRGGSVRWIDEVRNAPPLVLGQVDWVMRNGRNRHQMRLDATPPAEWGERFSIRGLFRQPLLSGGAGQWAQWSGQAYAEFTRIDASRLKQYVSLEKVGVDLTAGIGSLRAWADVSQGKVSGGTADAALLAVNARLGKALEPLALESVAGRFGGRILANGFEFSTEGLRFNTPDGLQWPGGNLSLKHGGSEKNALQQTELKADRLDLATLARIAHRLPLGTPTHNLIASYAPQGLVEVVQAKWQGPLEAPASFAVSGRVSALEISALPRPSVMIGTVTHALPGRPGVSGASIDFELTQTGGKAALKIADGALDLPGVFEDPRVALDQLSLEAQWKQKDGKIDTQLRNIRFSSADAEGQAEASWHSGEPAAVTGVASGRRYDGSLGVLDLQGSLTRGEGTRVHRYLPLVLPAQVRHYVRDSVVKGKLSEVKFRIMGPVDRIPFSDPSQGEFKISAQVSQGGYAYVPKSIQPRDAAPWPALTELNGELIFNRAALEVNAATGRFAGLPGMQITKVDARIPDLMHSATVDLNASMKGPLAEVLGFVNASPVAGMIGHALDQATASGVGDYGLQLNLPLHALDKTRVQGTLSLPGNDIRMTAASPELTRLKGNMTFSETGFNVAGAQARLLGGDVRFEGGMREGRRATGGSGNADTGEASVAFRAQGSVTAEGLRQAKDLGFVSGIAQAANGSAAYSASLGFRRGVAEIVVSSNLQGMALNLPAPLSKSADTVLPLRFENTLLRDSLAPGQKMQDQLSLTLGRVVSVLFVRDISAAEPRVIRGGIGVGLESDQSVPLPDSGVAANINVASVDLDAWEKVLATPAGSATSPSTPGGPAASPPGRSGFSAATLSYLPNTMAIRARELWVEGRKLHQVVVGGSRDGLNWRANIDAEELNGYVEFRQPANSGSGRVYARLSRLSLGQNSASDVESLLDQQPASIPALDIVVDELELRGRKLGRVEIEAVNRGASGGAREWRLNKLNVILPEAVMTATGVWAAVNASAALAPAGGPRLPRNAPERRHTLMNFKLDIADSGALLKRFGMNDVIRRGKGQMEGQVAWTGSPLGLDYPSMNGQFNVNIEAGQFLKADPGIAKLLGVLNLQALPRRLTLDFRDVFSEGFAFDFVRGDVHISQGVAVTNNLQMNGVNAAVLMEGNADLARETQDLKVVVVPEINAGTAALIATVINPAIGLGAFLAQYFLSRPLIQATTQEFHIDGSWTSPKITKVERKP